MSVKRHLLIESTFIFNEMLQLNCQFPTSLNRTESDQPFNPFEKGKLSPDGRNLKKKISYMLVKPISF